MQLPHQRGQRNVQDRVIDIDNQGRSTHHRQRGPTMINLRPARHHRRVDRDRGHGSTLKAADANAIAASPHAPASPACSIQTSETSA